MVKIDHINLYIVICNLLDMPNKDRSHLTYAGWVFYELNYFIQPIRNNINKGDECV